MPKQTYRKLDIAADYLTIATDLYFSGRYFASLGLASMAEEIFEAVMLSRNEATMSKPSAHSHGFRLLADIYSPISKQLIAIARTLNPELRGLKDREVYRRLYRVKLSAKHGTSPPGSKGFELDLVADPELEAWSMLGRAIENYMRLHYVPEGTVLEFFKQYQSGRKTWHEKGSSEGPHAKPYTIATPKPWK